jgi:hypothetical protein
MADSLSDLGWPMEDRILVLNVLHGPATATPTSGRGSHGRGLSPPSCRSVTTLSWRSLRASSQGPPPLQGPPRLHLLLLHRRVRLLHPHHCRLFWVLSPPGQAGVGGCGKKKGRGGGRGGGPGGGGLAVVATRLLSRRGVLPGPPSTTPDPGASPCGPSRLLVGSLARRPPCLLGLLQGSTQRPRGAHLPALHLGRSAGA